MVGPTEVNITWADVQALINLKPIFAAELNGIRLERERIVQDQRIAKLEAKLAELQPEEAPEANADRAAG